MFPNTSKPASGPRAAKAPPHVKTPRPAAAEPARRPAPPVLHVQVVETPADDAAERMRRAFALILKAAARSGPSTDAAQENLAATPGGRRDVR